MNIKEAYQAIVDTLSGRDAEELAKYAEDSKAYVDDVRSRIQLQNENNAVDKATISVKHRAIE